MSNKYFQSDEETSQSSTLNKQNMSLRPPDEEPYPPYEPPPDDPPQGDQFSPTGWLDSVDSGYASGWSYDPDNPSLSNDVHIYIGGPAGSGAAGYAVTANQPRPDVNQAFGIGGDHGFSFQIPAQYANGQQYAVYAYGIDTGANSPALLQGCPKFFIINPQTSSVSLNQVSPIAGSVAGGLSVTLTGSGFQPGAAVYFGNSPATQISVESGEVIRATSPAASGAGSVSVSVINPDGSSATLPGGFTYVASESGEQAEVLGVTPLAVIEDTNTVVTIRGRNLIEAYNTGVLALRGPSRCQITFLGTTTSRDQATGIDTVQMNVNIKCTPALAPLERMAIQVLASRRPEAAGDGVVESSKQMFTVLPKAVPVTLAYTANVQAGQPNLVMVSGRNLDGHSLALGDGTEVAFQKNDGNFLSGIVTLPEYVDASSPLQLSMLDSGGTKVAEYQMDVMPDSGGGFQKQSSGLNSASLAPNSDELALDLTPAPNQQFIGPTANDSAAFSVQSGSAFGYGFNWWNFEITILDVTIILPIVNEVYLIPFFDGGGDVLNSPVVAEVGKIFRLRGAGLLVAIRVEVQIHIQVVLIIGFYYQIWDYGFYNEFPEYGWSIGSMVIGIRVEIQVIFYLSAMAAIVLPNGQLRVIAAVNLTLGIDFSIDSDGRLHFDPIFTHRVQLIGIKPTPNNLQPCGGKFQLVSDDNGHTAFLDSLGGYESYYFAREAGECCVPWDFNMQLVRFSSTGQQEVIQSEFQADYCVTATESPVQYNVLVTSEPPPTGIPPTLVMDIGDTATLRALAVPVDSNGNPTGAPAQDLRDLGYGVEFFLALPTDQVLDPTTLPPGRADAILQGNNLIRAAVTSVRVLDDEPALAFWRGSIYGFRRSPSAGGGEEPRLVAGGLPVTVNPGITEIEVDPTLAYRDEQGKLQATTDIERFEPHEAQRQYVLAAKIKIPSGVSFPLTLNFKVSDAKMLVSAGGGTPVERPPLEFSRDKLRRNRDQAKDPKLFFTGNLVQTNQQISLTLDSRPNSNELVEISGFSIAPNQVEDGPAAPQALTKLVPPGPRVANRDVIVRINLSPVTANGGQNVSLRRTELNSTVRNEETYEEYFRVFQETRKVMVESGALNATGGKLRDFGRQFHDKLKSQGASNPLLKSEGQELWKLGCEFVQGASGIAAVRDDRLLYYARLQAIAALRNYSKRSNTPLSSEMVNLFEWSSRGLETADGRNAFIKFEPTASRKAIVTGFDPFFLNEQPEISNPSGLIALDFNNNPSKNFGTASSPAVVRTAVFPVRFRDFDGGLIEKVMSEGVKSTVLVMTCSQTGSPYYNVDRFATRYRTMDTIDNEHLLSATDRPSGNAAPYFIESTLPYEFPDVISINSQREGPESPNTPFVLNQSYLVANYSPAQGESPGKYRKDPIPGQLPAYQKLPEQPDANTEVVDGSGGNYLSNEIFYRTARVRRDNRPTLATGHLHVPPVGTEPRTKGVGLINGVTQILKDFLRHAFSPTGADEVNFPDAAVNSSGSSGYLTLSNPADNNSAIEIASVEFSTAGVFQITSSLPVVIQPGGSATLEFKFVPTEIREYTGTAKLKKSDGTVLYIVNLKGKGIASVPKINGFSPTRGAAGTIVTIWGENLGGATDVRLGDVSVNWFNRDSNTQITAEIPEGAFTNFIYVDTPNGTAVSPTMFRVIFVRPPYEY